MSNKRLIIALDFKNIDEMSNFISKLDPQKCIAKVGLQLFISEGPRVLEFLSHKGFEIFLDLKLHDIPNTVKKSVEEISQYNVKLTTIHLQGGRDMIQAANEAKGDTKILGVSLLTSLDDIDTRELYNNNFKKQFDNLINLGISRVILYGFFNVFCLCNRSTNYNVISTFRVCFTGCHYSFLIIKYVLISYSWHNPYQ